MNKSINALLRNPGKGFEPTRIVKPYKALSKRDEEAVIRFYDELAPEAKGITVDIELIVTKGFPVFEGMIGTANFKKVLRYFGIGVKSPAKNVKYSDVAILIAKLRTIENAQYYLYGFSELLEKYAVKLSKAPEEMDVITKAKVVRAFSVLFNSYLFFAEDYLLPVGATEPRVNYLQATEMNKKPLNPEEMFYLYKANIEKYSDGAFLYDAIIAEIKLFDKKVRKDIFEFAELKLDGTNQVISVNSRSATVTFGSVRSIKTKMFPRVGYFPCELYCVKDTWNGLEFGEIYTVYKALTQNDFSSFETKSRVMPYVEGNKFKERIFNFKAISPSVEMADLDEANRFIRFVEYLANTNVTMPIEVLTEGQKEPVTNSVEIGKFFSFVQFANECGYADSTTTSDTEYSMYLSLMECELADETLTEYMNGEISSEEVKTRLKIDKGFEERVFGIVHVESPMEAAKRFALEIGAVNDIAEISESLVENVLIHGNENLWERFSKGELSSSKLVNKLGLDTEILEMYFNLSKIDISVIEQKLQELKSRRVSAQEMKSHALTIILYCFIIEGQVACGPKNKAPKGNKRLKTSNLRMLIEAA